MAGLETTDRDAKLHPRFQIFRFQIPGIFHHHSCPGGKYSISRIELSFQHCIALPFGPQRGIIQQLHTIQRNFSDANTIITLLRNPPDSSCVLSDQEQRKSGWRVGDDDGGEIGLHHQAAAQCLHGQLGLHAADGEIAIFLRERQTKFGHRAPDFRPPSLDDLSLYGRARLDF